MRARPQWLEDWNKTMWKLFRSTRHATIATERFTEAFSAGSDPPDPPVDQVVKPGDAS